MEANFSPRIHRIALFSSLLSALVLGYLAYHHYSLVLGFAEGKSLCNISEKFDCDAVNTSTYSMLFGFPLALWGALTNLVLAGLIQWAVWSDRRDAYIRYASYLACFGAITSIAMGAISFVKLGNFCLFCVITYALSFLSAVTLGKLAGSPRQLAGDIGRLFKGGENGFLGVIFLLLFVPAGTWFIDNVIVSSHLPQLDLAVAESVAAWKRGQKHEFDTSKGFVMGNTSADVKMEIIEFADFLCPHCKHAAPQMRAFTKSHPDVRLIFLNFPLDSKCNPIMPREGASCSIAKAVFCAGQQAKGWNALEWAFENQGKVQEPDLANLPAQFGLDAAAFQACRDSSDTHDAIVKQAQSGEKAGLKGTPTVYVNGRELPRGIMIPVLEGAYRDLNP